MNSDYSWLLCTSRFEIKSKLHKQKEQFHTIRQMPGLVIHKTWVTDFTKEVSTSKLVHMTTKYLEVYQLQTRLGMQNWNSSALTSLSITHHHHFLHVFDSTVTMQIPTDILNQKLLQNKQRLNKLQIHLRLRAWFFALLCRFETKESLLSLIMNPRKTVEMTVKCPAEQTEGENPNAHLQHHEHRITAAINTQPILNPICHLSSPPTYFLHRLISRSELPSNRLTSPHYWNTKKDREHEICN